VDSAVAAGTEISPHYDSMISKVIAHGDDRAQAFARLRKALAGYVLVGIDTNLDFLRAACADAELLRTPQPTSWLDTREDLSLASPPEQIVRIQAVFATMARRADEQRRTGRLPEVLAGWRNVYGVAETARWRYGDKVVAVSVVRTGRETDRIEVDAHGLDIKVLSIEAPDLTSHCAGAVVDAEVNGMRWRCRVLTAGDACHVVGPDWQTAFTVEAGEAGAAARAMSGSCTAPLPGTVLSVRVQPGAKVAEGDPLVVLESMKMEHVVRARSAMNVAAVHVGVGDSVALGEVLVVLSEDA
jgi:acetyl/propionyl-CoA carboxylase alpha subunit